MSIGSVTVRRTATTVSSRTPTRTVATTDGQNTLTGLQDVDLTGVQNNDVLIYDAVSNKIKPRTPENAVNETLIRTLNFIIDGGGGVITTGSKGNVAIDFSANISGWSILNDVVGNINISVSKTTYNTFGVFVGSGGTAPNTMNSLKNSSDNINWTSFNTVSANDILQFTVSNTVTNITKTTISLKLSQIL